MIDLSVDLLAWLVALSWKRFSVMSVITEYIFRGYYADTTNNNVRDMLFEY